MQIETPEHLQSQDLSKLKPSTGPAALTVVKLNHLIDKR